MDAKKLTLDDYGIDISTHYRYETDSYLVTGRKDGKAYTVEISARVVESGVKLVMEIIRDQMIYELTKS